VGALDAHWDAIGAGIREGDVVNVVGTSTCVMGIVPEIDLIPGVSGVVKGSIHPDFWGIEAGLAAVGDIFNAISKRAGRTISELSENLDTYKAGQTGLMRMTWDNGDRTILVNPELSGMTLGWTLASTARDELFAAIEGTAFHTRIIFERMVNYGVPVRRVINSGGIPQKSDVLNQVYANVFAKTILVPEQDVTSLGSAIFAFLAAGTFKTVEEAQKRLCPSFKEFVPEEKAVRIYKRLYNLYKRVYFSFGQENYKASLATILPTLRKTAARLK
jgi:L-ribulokinase